MRVYIYNLEGNWASGQRVVAANNTREADKIVKEEIPTNLSIDERILLKDVTASGKPRVLTGHDYIE